MTPAHNLYRGRAFGIARNAAKTTKSDLGIVSAGLGYVRGETPIPGYDLTVRPRGPGSVLVRVEGSFDVREWWRAVGRGRYAVDLASDAAKRPSILVCLSRSYARLIADDLQRVGEAAASRLRIFGLSISNALPASLRSAVLPYDERLSNVGRSGTRVDFSQRALADYLEHILPNTGFDLSAEKKLVEYRLSQGAASVTRPQRRVDDATIKALIERLLPSVGRQSSRMLAHIRRQEGLSCEQRRFADLFREVCGGSS